MKTFVFVLSFLFFISTIIFSETTPSLDQVLNPDGTIKEGVTGSFDPNGYKMSYLPDGTPVFSRFDNQEVENPFLTMNRDEGYWRPLGPGHITSYVFAIAVMDLDVYVGCETGIARWDGTQWHSLGTGLNGRVRAIAISGTDVYVVGDFTEAGGNPDADGIARWDGSNWHALGAGLTNFYWVRAIAISGTDVYVGGWFNDAGGNPDADRIARWDGTQWHALGNGLNSTVY